MTRKIQVLCIGRSLAGGGAERVQIELIQELKRTTPLTVFYMDSEGPLREFLPADVRVIEGTIGKRFGPRANVRSLLTLLRLARQCDVIFGMQETTPLYLAVVLGLLTRTPRVGWIHATWSRQKVEVPRVHTQLVRLFYPLIHRFVAVSAGTAQSLVTELPLLRRRITVIFNPLNRDKVLSRAQEPLPLPDQPMFSGTTFVTLGRLEPVKGHDLLIDAFSRLEPRPGLQLVIVGEGSQRDELLQRIHTLGVADRVHLVGFRTNPYPYLQQASAFVLSSRFEGLPTVLVEALLLQKPIIATDCESGPREILENGRYGWLIPPDDVEALYEAMTSFLNEPLELQARVAQGATSVERFAPPHIAQQFQAVFDEVTRRPSTPV